MERREKEGRERASISLWNLVVEILERKLATWKARYLSLRGCLILIKTALFNLSTYFLLIFKCPVEVVVRIEKLQ